MEKHKELTENRIAFIADKMWAARFESNLKIEAKFYKTAEPIALKDVPKSKMKKIDVGETWGGPWDCAWFSFSSRIPKEWKKVNPECQVVLQLDLNGEGLWTDETGNAKLGLVSPTSDGFRKDFMKTFLPIDKKEVQEGKFKYWVEAGANPLTSYGNFNNLDLERADYIAKLVKANLALYRKDIFQLYVDFDFLRGLMMSLPKDSFKRAQLLRLLNEVCNVIGDFEFKNVKNCRKLLAPEMNKKAHATVMKGSAIGHAHIDLAWLWPVRETIRKAGRTFANQIALLKKYPDFKFGASQPHLYEFVKERYPSLFKDVKKYVKQKRWEVQGAMWVEADCNLAGGEALVRQVLYGKKYFMDEFGVEVNNLWLPDVFGYSAALPQILKKANVDYFFTQKICWSEFNDFPHHTFNWVGIDGSSVFSHFAPANTYNSPNDAEGLLFAEKNFKEKDRTSRFLHLFGIGDGGGGPSEMHVERALRAKDLEGVPKLEMEFASDFFKKAEKEISDLPIWNGELYLEFHRGTYTTQANNKKWNRKCELSLRNTEFLWSVLGLPEYPAAEIEALWKKVLFNQFHDIIPGSSVKRVHDESCRELHDVFVESSSLQEEVIGFSKKKKASKTISIINTLSWDRKELVSLPKANSYEDHEGNGYITQAIQKSKLTPNPKEVLVSPYMLSMANTNLVPSQKKVSISDTGLKVSSSVMENRFLKISFNKEGKLSSIFDKEQEIEFLEKGQEGNKLAMYEDRPNDYDAWDVMMYYEEKEPVHAKKKSFKIIEKGPLRAIVEITYELGASKIVQEIRMSYNSRRIDFVTFVDWQENQKILKAQFPTSIKSPEASYEIQYGYVKRPTHRNTSWDYARFEVVGHRWADLSNKDFGFSLLNDCKYGYKVHENLMELSLLRAPNMPDPKADRGEHLFTYSIIPHLGDLEEARVVRQAAELNQEVLVKKGLDLPEQQWFDLSSEHVIIESIKKWETGRGLVLRLYETHGHHVSCKLEVPSDITSAVLTDLLERPETKAKLSLDESQKIALTFSPFEIKTVLLKV